MNNQLWSEKILKIFHPTFKHRWEVYEEYLQKSLSKKMIWIDLGCGYNLDINEKRYMVFYGAGVDLVYTKSKTNGPFIIADICDLPFKSNSIHIISLRFVIEHIKDTNRLLREINRVLVTDGTLILLTTNFWSPLILLPKLLPFSIRRYIIKTLFKVQEDDIFPTYHNLNTYLKVKNVPYDLHLTNLEFIQDLNYTNRVVFIILMIYHSITRIGFLKIFRTNLLVVYKKMKHRHQIA